MNETTTLTPSAEDVETYQAAIEQYLADMRLLQVSLDKDQEEIELLQAETKVILADIMAGLPRPNGSSQR